MYILSDTLEIVHDVRVGYHPRYMAYVPSDNMIVTCNLDNDSATHEKAGLSIFDLSNLSQASTIQMPEINPSFFILE